jgi:hypothetical protein
MCHPDCRNEGFRVGGFMMVCYGIATRNAQDADGWMNL